MRRQNLGAVADDGSQPVMVPRSGKTLAPASPERARRLRAHLVAALRKSRTMTNRAHAATSPRREPEGFVARVAQTACAMCKGWCCKGGGDHAYLDEQTMARVRGVRPDLEARAVLLLYVQAVPAVGYEGSCVFHGQQGCTLPRSLRSDVCNDYFCAGLEAWVTDTEAAASAVVIAGEGGNMRISPVLVP